MANNDEDLSKSLTLLKKIGQNIVSVSQQCLLNASNIFVLDLQADTINLSDVVINPQTNQALTNCSLQTGLAQEPVNAGVQRALQGVTVRSPDGLVRDPYARYNGHQDGVDFTLAVRTAVNVEVVNRCLAMALNSMVIRFKNAKSITIKNMTVTQVANVEITDCIGNVEVRIGDTTQTLMQFLERNESQYDYTEYKGREPFACQHMITGRTTLKYAAAGAIGFALLILLIVLIVKLV